MSRTEKFEFEAASEAAWRRFRARLADHLAEMKEDDLLCVEASSAIGPDEEGAAPYVQFRGCGEGMLRSEVSSNEFLAPSVRLDEAGVAAVAELGWCEPNQYDEAASPNFCLDVEQIEADRLAVMTTRVLREVFGVPHPVFLSANGLENDPEPVAESPLVGAERLDEFDFDEHDAPSVLVARDRDELLEMVDEALRPMFGDDLKRDEDGDIPIVTGSALVWVRVSPDRPAIELFSWVACGVTDPERAAFEVTVLNRDERYLKFTLEDDMVVAQTHLVARPFCPEQLRQLLEYTCRAVDRIDDDVAVRVGGTRFFDSDPSEEQPNSSDSGAADDTDGDSDASVHPAMLTLLELDAEEPESVGPELAASICGNDRDLILELSRWNQEQELEWRRARDQADLQGDPDEARVCRYEQRHARRFTKLLRAALRVVVERQLELERTRRVRASESASRPKSGRPRRAPDPTLEEVDPEIWS